MTMYPVIRRPRERGLTLTTIAFATAVLLTGMGTMFLVASRTNLELVHHGRLQAEAGALANGGIERAIERVRQGERSGFQDTFDLVTGEVKYQAEPGLDATRWTITSQGSLHLQMEHPVKITQQAEVQVHPASGKVVIVSWEETK